MIFIHVLFTDDVDGTKW